MLFQIESILSQHGIVVITRNDINIEKTIFESDLLTKYRKNIKVITNWAVNEISSTICRRLIRRGLSVKYLLDDNVTEYIKRNKLYRTTTNRYHSKLCMHMAHSNYIPFILAQICSHQITIR